MAAQQLRVVRNACADGMTDVTSQISQRQQWEFWTQKLSPENAQYEAYLLQDGFAAIGYGLLKKDQMSAHGYNEDIYWMTAGLIPEVRGRGLSRTAIALITEMAHAGGRVPWIEVYDWNLALINDVRVGYRYVDSREAGRGRILIMRHQHDRETKEGYEGIPQYVRPLGHPGG